MGQHQLDMFLPCRPYCYSFLEAVLKQVYANHRGGRIISSVFRKPRHPRRFALTWRLLWLIDLLLRKLQQGTITLLSRQNGTSLVGARPIAVLHFPTGRKMIWYQSPLVSPVPGKSALHFKIDFGGDFGHSIEQ